MNTQVAKTIAHAEKVITALRQLSELPAAKAWDVSGHELLSSLIQFFPIATDRDAGFSVEARAFARALGGTWQRDPTSRKWESTNVAGLEGVKVVLHYVEPRIKEALPTVDLSDDAEDPARERDEPDYDAPKPLTPMENTLRNDEHFVS